MSIPDGRSDTVIVAAMERVRPALADLRTRCLGAFGSGQGVDMDMRGRCARLAGILPGNALMHERLKALGYQSAPMPGGVLRGHTFEHSSMQSALTPAARAERRQDGSAGEAIYTPGRLIASYFHAYFPSSPQAAAQVLQA